MIRLTSLAIIAAAMLADNAPDDVTVVLNLEYREHSSRHCVLDLAMPKLRAEKPRPAIVVIHGGGWIEGDKSSFVTSTNRAPGNILDFARLGFVAASVNYRLSGEAPWPAAFDDCRAAVRFLRAQSEKYQIDPDRIGAWGNSAGGHLALLLGMAPPEGSLDASEPWRDQSSGVQAVASDSGPIDLVFQVEQQQLTGVIEKFMGGPPIEARLREYRRASPATYVSDKIPPLLLIYGAIDEQVNVRTADDLVDALGRAGHNDVSYIRLAKVGHCPHSLIRVAWLPPVVNEFFSRTLRLEPRR